MTKQRKTKSAAVRAAVLADLVQPELEAQIAALDAEQDAFLAGKGLQGDAGWFAEWERQAKRARLVAALNDDEYEGGYE